MLLAAAFVVLAATAADEPKARYLVETIARAPIELPFANEQRIARRFTKFRAVDGYAVDLTPSEVARLRRAPHVRSIELDAPRYLTAIRPQTIPWGAAAINAPAAWSVTRGEGIRVGIIDTGIDAAHAELIANYKGGYDFVRDDGDPNEESPVIPGHGTIMAGVIAAADDGRGTTGVAPRAELYALKVFGHRAADSSDIIEAIDWAIANGMHVLSCSFGGDRRVQLEEAAFRRAREAGIIIVASSGNNAGAVNCPACYDDLVIAVGAVDERREVAPFSNFGSQLDFVAPGIDVISTAVTGSALAGRIAFDDGTTVLGSRIHGDDGAQVSGAMLVAGRGATRASNDEQMAAARASGASGVVFVNQNDAPCSFTITKNKANPPAICVAKSDGPRVRQSGTLTIFAGDYTVASGTSMAAPHVAGAAALILAANRDADVEQVLIDTAADLGGNGWDPSSGYGLIDAGAAVAKVAPPKMKRRRSPRAVW